MPFIGRDWRSPGEAWVKTESLGWQRMKIIESQLHPTCNQNPACSWPPRGEYGQHMIKHCRVHDINSTVITGEEIRSSSSDSSNSSNCSSRGGSLGPSLSGSPEKIAHHIYPLAISSPYGRHSIESSGCGCDKFSSCCANNTAQMMSRSLSRESLIPQNNQILRNSTIRYNRSVSDFRESTSSPEDNLQRNNNCVISLGQLKDSSTTDDNTGHGLDLSPPMIMRNGQKIDELESNNVNATEVSIDDGKQRGLIETKTNCCCCCCCCFTPGNTSPCNFYPLKENNTKTAPHCRISVRTREVAMYNTISEAFYRLDFCNAIHDIRRFNYICKLLHLLITQNLTSLSGCATRVLFSMLEQVAWEVSNNKRNIHILKNLLNELRQMIEKYYCWGRPIGSSLLWQQHFETIERISQIVDGIELAPPKSDQNQATFNDLPIEMIREILLRLNDYRDLVNSARASPVMQIMIDNQYIWQKLCKYHFTEQQLRHALDNRYNLMMKRKSIHGVKYARTASADGRGSYRNLVSHPSKKHDRSDEQPRNQRQGVSDDRSTSKDNRICSRDSSSYVTRAIRIFDKEGSSLTLGSSLVKRNVSDSSRRARQPDKNVISCSNSNRRQSRLSSDDQEPATPNSQTNNSPRVSNNDIDWERAFHQLRKKFDLKEEYPDCLLLCRHCRCLFWKSFGHPCIKGDELPVNQCIEKSPNNSKTSTDRHNVNGLENQSLDRAVAEDQSRGRRSVADLSRNFGERSQTVRNPDAENIPPNRVGSSSSSSSSSSNNRNSNNLRPSNVNLNVQRALNQRINGQLNNNNNYENLPPRSTRKDEVVPKHVAISPQAFLKFFSL